MTWPRALLCWLVAALCAALYLVAAQRPTPVAAPGMLPTPAPAAERGYELDAARLDRVELRRGDATVVLARDGDRWKVVAPTDRTIPGGLVQAFVDQLVDSGHGERIAEDAHNAAFGFASPELRIDASEAGGKRLSLVVGARTPAGTAAYALIEQQGLVVLVGLNLLYYGNLLLG